MGIRQVTGYIAHFLLGLYWIWIISSTAPQLRRNIRDRQARLRILMIKTAGIVLTAVVVGIIHFWATEWWHVILAVLVAAPTGLYLNKVYRRLVAAPRHRITLGRRARRFRRRFRGPPNPVTDAHRRGPQHHPIPR